MEPSGIIASIYHNFYSVCALIPATFMLSLGTILLMVPRKSKATLHLGTTYIMMALFFFGYVIAAMVYHPAAAYHRWITAGFVTFAEIHFILSLLNLPEEKYPRAGRILGMVLYFVSGASCVAFAIITYHSPKIYHFAGHYWDFDADAISTYIAILIIAYLILLFAVGLWRIIIIKSGLRWTILSILMFIFISIMIPAIANLLSRNGILDRGTYQITQYISTVIGFFAVFVIFFNTTKERTSLLVKILGISYATLLIMIQAVSYFSLRSLDAFYDTLKKNDMVIVMDTNRTVPDLSYLVEYSCGDDRTEMRKGAMSGTAIDFQSLRSEYFNTVLLERIRLIGARSLTSFRDEIHKILDVTPPFFGGYRAAILAKVDRLPADTTDPGAEIIGEIDSLQLRVASMAVGISKLPDHGFAGRLRDHLHGSHGGMEHFSGAILSHIAAARADGPELKREVLGFLSPMRPVGQRRYRTGADGMTHHIAFMEFDPVRKVLHEAAFDYRAYREFHHRTAKKHIIIFAVIIAAIFLGFRFFFLGAYVRPLKRLLDAINRVREGNYDIAIPITVNDELGYISHNFNEMAGTLQMSREALSDYAENLEKMVNERTLELEKACDTIWSEMELARKMQTILVPDHPRMDGYEVTAYMAPAEMVGGDYYDIINQGGMDWVVIGDVSGHGVPAGIIMMMVQTSIHTILAGNPGIRPSNLLERVNTVITDNIKKLREDKYMTITVIACLSSGRLTVSGLHQDILIYRSLSKRVEAFRPAGILLGLKDLLEYNPEDRELNLERGDVMLLYTDGITESWRKGSVRNRRNPRLDMFGQDRLADILLCNHNRSAEEIRDAVLEELEGFQCIDDVTMVIIRKT
ncbi:MAG: SpoIIE family protein phosphatase [Spirochaetes bacterium]|nr:SpoIIE family protein phosphatase [Spirochaetota bacterium]